MSEKTERPSCKKMPDSAICAIILNKMSAAFCVFVCVRVGGGV